MKKFSLTTPDPSGTVLTTQSFPYKNIHWPRDLRDEFVFACRLCEAVKKILHPRNFKQEIDPKTVTLQNLSFVVEVDHPMVCDIDLEDLIRTIREVIIPILVDYGEKGVFQEDIPMFPEDKEENFSFHYYLKENQEALFYKLLFTECPGYFNNWSL